MLRSWISKKFMSGWYKIIILCNMYTAILFLYYVLGKWKVGLPFSVILLPLAITFYVTWWFIQFVDGFFSPIYAHLGINIFGKTIVYFLDEILIIKYNDVSSLKGATFSENM